MINRKDRSVSSLRAVGNNSQGVAAIEFAFIFPILLILLLAGTQTVLYVNATRKVGQVARSISQMISQAAPPGNSSIATITAGDLHFAYDSTLVIFPYVMSDARRQNRPWWYDISINFSSISFAPKSSSSCNDPADQSACYTANVVWTSPGLSSSYRPCGVPQLPADNTAPPSSTTLPRSVFGPASLVVVDVVFVFKPLFGSAVVPPLTIARSAYVQPRYASLINLDPNNGDPIASRCPGY